MEKIKIISVLFGSFILLGTIFGISVYYKNIKTENLFNESIYQVDKIQFKELIELKKSITYLSDVLFEHQISINAIGEDYPPKKKLSERSWCDIECLKHQIK